MIDSAIPTESERRVFRLTDRLNKPLHQGQPTGLAPSIATDVGHRPVLVPFQELFTESGWIESPELQGAGGWRRGMELFTLVGADMLLAIHIHVGTIRWQWGEIGRATSCGNDDGQLRCIADLIDVSDGKALFPSIGLTVPSMHDQTDTILQ